MRSIKAVARLAVAAVLLALAPIALAAQEAPVSEAAMPEPAPGDGVARPATARLSIATGPVLVAGYLDELVYRNPSSTDLLSRLRWPLLPANGLRLDVSLHPAWDIPLGFSLRTEVLFPTITGTMVDEDWMAESLVYGRSQHEAQLARGAGASIFATWTFDGPRLEVGLGGTVSDLSWEGWNGSAVYDYGTFIQSMQFSGIVIAYRALRAGPAASLAWTPSLGGLDLRLGFEAGTYALHWGVDSHLARNPDLTFFDMMPWSLFARPSIAVSWPLAEGVSLKVALDASIERFARGDDYIIDDAGNASVAENLGGQEFTAGALSVTIEVAR